MENKNINTRKPRSRNGLFGAAAFIFVLGILSGMGYSGDLPGFNPGQEAPDQIQSEATITPTTGEIILAQTVTTLRPPRPTIIRPTRPPNPRDILDPGDCGTVRPCILRPAR